MRFTNIIIGLLALLLSCQTNPPTISENGNGILSVSANLNPSKIYIDNVLSEFTTPAEFEISAGIHEIFLENNGIFSDTQSVEIYSNQTTEISLFFGSTTKTVILEDFANVSCDPCVISSEIIKNLKHRFDENQLIVLRFSTNFPSPNDPLYLANQNLFDERISFYNVLFAPTTIVDGNIHPISTDSLEIIDAIENQLLIESPIEISVNKDYHLDTLKTQVEINILNSEEINSQNLILHLYVVKKVVEFTTPPGSNGETIFYDVVFESLTSLNGFSLNDYISQPNFTLNFSKKLAGLNEDNIHIIGLIQNSLTKEIYNSSKSN